MIYSCRSSDQFQEPSFVSRWSFPLKKNTDVTTYGVSPVFPQMQKVANRISEWPARTHSQYISRQNTYRQSQDFSRLVSAVSYKGLNSKTTLWKEFKRIYITEVMAFTMSKSTIFALIFSFMFLGCIFFLSGFFTAANLYREQHVVHAESRQHVPTETAILQGRPEKIVNMGTGLAYAAPQAYQHQGGVKVDQTRRRPSIYAERYISGHQANYR